MPYTFDPINRYIGIPPGEIVTHMSDIYNEAMDWADSPEGVAHPVPLRATGKIPLGSSGAYTDVVYSLINNYKLKYLGGYATPPWPVGLDLDPGILLEDFATQTSIDAWNVVTGNASIEADFTYFKGLDDKRAIRFNLATGPDITIRNMFDTPTNFSWVNNYSWWVYFPDLASVDHVHWKLLMSADGNRGFQWMLDPQHFRHGWNHIILDKSQFTAFGAAQWTEDVYGWETHTAVTTDTFFTMDEIYVNSSATPTFSFLFRDARIGLYDNRINMQEMIPYCCAYIDMDQVGTADFCSIAQLDELYDLGMEFYPTSHMTLIGADEHTVHAELRRQQAFLEDHGWTRGCYIYKFSSEGYDDELIRRLNFYFDHAITNVAGYNSYPWIHFPYELKMFRLDAATQTVDDIKGYMDIARDTGTNIILGFRDIISDNTPPNTANYSYSDINQIYLHLFNQSYGDGRLSDNLIKPSNIILRQGVYQSTILGTCVTEDGSARTIQPDEGTVEVTFEVSSAATIHAPVVNIDVPTPQENATAVWNNGTAVGLINLLTNIWRFFFNRKVLTKNNETSYTEEIFYEDGRTSFKTTQITKSGNVETRQ